ncbi:MAG: vitamin K epoxide reductase family protein [bacterium]|nr:vitamin K epoxide reductase family protein [bacterium]
MMNPIPYFIIIAAACAGFLIALHIRRKKQAEEKFVCPLNFDCDAVVRSKYSRVAGVPIEIGGLIYYALITASYALFYFAPTLLSPIISLAVLATSGGAVLFSLYLTGVQMFALKEWCSWCLASASMCAVIFGSALWIFLI